MKSMNFLFLVFAVLFGTLQIAQADLIAYYPFDEDADDHSDNNLDGEIIGGVDPGGAGSGFDGVGGAFEFGFDGPGHVVIPLDINPEELPQLTVTMWVKADESIINEDVSTALVSTYAHISVSSRT